MRGRQHILRIIRELLAFKPNGKKTDVAKGLEYFNSVIKKKSVCFILSDFISPDFKNEYFFIIMFVLILFTHRENVKRLINKEESKTKIY